MHLRSFIALALSFAFALPAYGVSKIVAECTGNGFYVQVIARPQNAPGAVQLRVNDLIEDATYTQDQSWAVFTGHRTGADLRILASRKSNGIPVMGLLKPLGREREPVRLYCFVEL